jgi:hypothetical protein
MCLGAFGMTADSRHALTRILTKVVGSPIVDAIGIAISVNKSA